MEITFVGLIILAGIMVSIALFPNQTVTFLGLLKEGIVIVSKGIIALI